MLVPSKYKFAPNFFWGNCACCPEAADNTPWTGISGSDGKLFLQSGKFSSTLKDSEDVSAQLTPGSSPTGITWDGTDTPWCINSFTTFPNNSYAFKQSGQFTSTIKLSHDYDDGGTHNDLEGISWDATDTITAEEFRNSSGNDKLVRYSGMFTSTIKDSEDITSVDTLPEGASYDSGDTPWTGRGGGPGGKLYKQQGQFTSTILTSTAINSVLTPGDISWDGTNTLVTDTVSPGKLMLISGQFSTTVKTSQDVSTWSSNFDLFGINTNTLTVG